MKAEAINRRLLGLDLFRIMATLWIFLFHSQMHFNCDYGAFNSFVRLGAMDMTGFFLLSGFSLEYTYSNKKHFSENAWTFYKKRAVSIYPLYWTASILYILFIGQETFFQNIVLVPVEALGIQAAFRTLFPISHNGGTWFISCMLICYILFPFAHDLINGGMYKFQRVIAIILGAILLFSPFVVSIFSLGAIYESPFFRYLEFVIGTILFKEAEHIKNEKLINLLKNPITILVEFAILVISVSIAARVLPANYMLFSWIGLPMFSLLIVSLYFVNFSKVKPAIISIISGLSTISYAFYLSQFFTWSLGVKILEMTKLNSNSFRIMLSLAICIILSLLLHYVIERPSKRILNRY